MPKTKIDQYALTRSSSKTIDKTSFSSSMKISSSQIFNVQREESRQQKVRRYLWKKKIRKVSTKQMLGGRKRVADKKLRVGGKFVTREQAFKCLGLSQNELLTNTAVQELLKEQTDISSTLKSVVQHGECEKLVKVQNF